MKYYRQLNFNKKTFANTPDPEMFFKASQYLDCLQELERAIRLRRGLSVVIGKSGSGKTTLSRQLLHQLTTVDQGIQAQLIVDPQCGSAPEFLQAVSKSFGLPINNEPREQQLKNNIKSIKRYLEQAAERGKTPALIIDNGQNLPDFVLEILGVFLTFAVNQHKLLQIVIFARENFSLILRHKTNLTGQIATRLCLRPLSLRETKQMISFRLSKSHRKSTAAPRIFSSPAVWLIYLLSGGYPRRIVALCSRLIIALLVKNKQRAGLFDLLLSLKANSQRTQPHRKGLIIILALSGITTLILSPEIFHRPAKPGVRQNILLSAAPAKAEGTKPLPSTVKTAIRPDEARPSEHKKLRRRTIYFPMQVEPAILGELQVHNGDTLSKMIARVYGRYTKIRLELVRKANKVSGLGQLRPGIIIKFPGEAKVNFQPAAHEFWLQLGVMSTLPAAVDVLKDCPASAPPIIIVPARRSEKDKAAAFMIVLEKRFKKKSAAVAVLKSLPSNLRDQAIIRHQ